MSWRERFPNSDLPSTFAQYQSECAAQQRPIINSLDRIADALNVSSYDLGVKICQTSSKNIREYTLLTGEQFPDMRNLADWRGYTSTKQEYSLFPLQSLVSLEFAIKCKVGADSMHWQLPHKVGGRIVWEEVGEAEVARYLSKKIEQNKKENEEVMKYKARDIDSRTAFYKFRTTGIVSNYETYCLKKMLSVNGNEISHSDLAVLRRCNIYDDVYERAYGGNNEEKIKPQSEEIIIWKAGFPCRDNNGNSLMLTQGEFYLKNEDGSKKEITRVEAYNFLKNLTV